jgi:hypothetical protein
MAGDVVARSGMVCVMLEFLEAPAMNRRVARRA